jgi:hypothetical protein
MTHTYPSDDSLLVHLLVVSVAFQVPVLFVTFFLLITVHIMDYHWDHHLYFVIHPHHAQTMTHATYRDSLLVHLLVVLVACDSD